jgi:hypothetical protein
MLPGERSAMEQRARELEERHERQLHELGRLALEMHRRDELDGEALMARAAELAQIEKDLGTLHVALESDVASGEQPDA